MKISWGWKIACLYCGFVIFMSSLVIASSRQRFDLVSKDYYGEEIAYQKVLDAGKNQSELSEPFAIYANDKVVVVNFPEEFKNKQLFGTIQFYSPVNSDWDRNYKIVPINNGVTIDRNALHNTRYTIKISCVVNGKNYYQESEIMLHS